MGYGKEVYQSAQQILTERKGRAEALARQHESELYLRSPRSVEIHRSLFSTAVKAGRMVLSGGNVRENLEKLKEENLLLQKEQAEILTSLGFPQDYLETKYTCSACGDTGYVDGKMCSCLKKLLREEAYKALNRSTPLSLSSFESFSLDYYKGEELKKMQQIYDLCKEYAETFSPSSQSILMYGSTGLGKTHLSLSVASRVIEKGFGVVYGSVLNLAVSLEKERFDRESTTSENLTGCDLLILDDLGTEYQSPYLSATLYGIVNTRLIEARPTIISSNLLPKELAARYGERFLSRLIGEYLFLPFSGKDVRQQKRFHKASF